MNRSDQNGSKAPRQGTLQRQSQSGVSTFTVPAITRFPPPEFLTDVQRNLWIASLSDVPLEFFRARHIPMMIQYVRAVERMMFFSDQFDADPEDNIALGMWNRMLGVVSKIERHLSLNTGRLIDTVVRARSEMRVANQGKNMEESGEEQRGTRAGLTYVGH